LVTGTKAQVDILFNCALEILLLSYSLHPPYPNQPKYQIRRSAANLWHCKAINTVGKRLAHQRKMLTFVWLKK